MEVASLKTFLKKKPGCFLPTAPCESDSADNFHNRNQFQVWRKDFSHMAFRAASSHAVCAQCIRHKALIAGLGHHLAARRRQQELYAAHLRQQFLDRSEYWVSRGRSRQGGTEITLICDGMDQSKFSVPRSGRMRAKLFDGFARPRLHVSGLICHGHFILMAVSEPDLKKDSNTSIEIIAHAIERLRMRGVRLSEVHLNIQADNTCREVKNSMLLRFAASQISCGNLLSIKASFLRTGHSHGDIDQVFGSLAQYLVRVRTAQTSAEVTEHIQQFLNKLPRPHEQERIAIKLDQTRDWILGLRESFKLTETKQIAVFQ